MIRRAAALFILFAFLLVAAPPAGAQEQVRPITFPVHRDSVHLIHWSDTFGAPRGGGRSHIGVDIMGQKMLPLVAVADGQVSWLRHDASRGNNLEITDADGWSYHYIHINNDTPGTDDGANDYAFAFAPGVVPGARVQAGQIVAYMGDSGNAENSGAHLHFEIERPDGTAINPTPSVDRAASRLDDLPELSPDELGPYDTTLELVDDVYDTLVGRQANGDELLDLANDIDQRGLAAALAPFVDNDSIAADVDRLYVAFFLRLPDFGGYQYWIQRMSTDLGLVAMADHFAESSEFEERYGRLDFSQFLDQLYRDVLDRAPDEGGKAYWLTRLADPDDTVTKGTIVAFFTDSPEMRGLAEHRSELVALTALFEDRMPTDAELEAWGGRRSSSALHEAIGASYLS